MDAYSHIYDLWPQRKKMTENIISLHSHGYYMILYTDKK